MTERRLWLLIGAGCLALARWAVDRLLRERWSDYRWAATRRDDVLNAGFDDWLHRVMMLITGKRGRRWSPDMPTRAEAEEFMRHLATEEGW